MIRRIVAFDVDGTLITFDDIPRYDVINTYKYFQRVGCEMIIWSGGGIDYATHWADKLGLKPDQVIEKGSIVPDIAFDDEDVDLGKVNIKAKYILTD